MDAMTLSERLVERRLLSSDELERLTKLQSEQQSPLTRLVVELGFLSEEDLLPVLRDHFDIPVMSLRDVPNVTLPIDLPPGIGEFSSKRLGHAGLPKSSRLPVPGCLSRTRPTHREST